MKKKILRWEKERAEAINRMPRSDRGKEGWKMSKESSTTETEIKIKSRAEVTEKEEKIRDIIKDFWKRIIKKDDKNISKIRNVLRNKHNGRRGNNHT